MYVLYVERKERKWVVRVIGCRLLIHSGLILICKFYIQLSTLDQMFDKFVKSLYLIVGKGSIVHQN